MPKRIPDIKTIVRIALINHQDDGELVVFPAECIH